MIFTSENLGFNPARLIQNKQRARTAETGKIDSNCPAVILINDFCGGIETSGRGGKSDSALCALAFQDTLQRNGVKLPEFHIIDDVLPFNIINGAFIIDRAAQFAPDGSTIIGVIDPGVGTERQGIIIETQKHIFVGPNNGIFYPAAEREGILQVREIDPDGFLNSSVTFHGRDIFSRVAGEIASGKLPESFGRELLAEELVPLHFQNGQIVHIDAYGNYKINTTVPEQAQSLIITMSDPVTIPFTRTFEDVGVGKPLAYIGSDKLLEIAIREGNAFNTFKHNVGECLSFTWNVS